MPLRSGPASRRARWRRAGAQLAILAACALGAACPGDGTKVPILDDGDDDGGANGLPFPPRFSEIASRVLVPTCSPGCHAPGGIAPFSMATPAQAYANLVGVPNGQGVLGSGGTPMLRVDPGNPDRSYIILKLEGSPGIVGDRMPLFLPPLEPEVIDTISEWIARGAMND